MKLESTAFTNKTNPTTRIGSRGRGGGRHPSREKKTVKVKNKNFELKKKSQKPYGRSKQENFRSDKVDDGRKKTEQKR